MKKFFFWLILIFIVIIISIAGSETIIRIFDKIKGVTAPYTHNLPECMAVPNGYFNYDLVSNLKIIYDSNNPRKFTTNRWGFRSADYNPIKPKGAIRIFCVGGSSTFDPYVSDEQSWVYLLGKKLSKKLNKKVESINAGRYAYSTSEIVGLFYHRILRHQPDMIVLYSTYNDAFKSRISPYYGSDDGPQFYGNPTLSFLNKHSALFAFLDYRLRYVWKSNLYISILPTYSYFKQPPPEHFAFLKNENKAIQYNIDAYERNVKTIISIAKSNNVKVLLSTQIIDTIGKPAYLISLLNNSLRKIATEENVPLLDIDELKIDKPRKSGILKTQVHLTPKGCEYLSDKMTNIIIKDSLIY